MRLLLFLGFSCCIFLASCSAMRNASIKEDDKQIPAGFGSEDITLLVLKQHRKDKYNKNLEKNFKSHYTGAYVFVTSEELFSETYADTKKYRYVFGEDTDDRVYQSNMGAAPYELSLFYVKDREDNKIYKTKRASKSKPWMRAYIKKLEEVRKKNKR